MISKAIEKSFTTLNLSSVIFSIEREISYLAEFPDTQATILFRLDGQVLASNYRDSASQELLTVITWVRDIIAKTTKELQNGSKSVKYDKEIDFNLRIPVYFYCAGNSSILVTIMNSRANTGLMEIEMSRTAKRLGWIIDKKEPLGD